MPRRGKIAKRDVLPDPLYNSKLVTRLINNVMIDGKKGVAQKIVYEAFDIIREKTGKEPLEVFEAAMENARSRSQSSSSRRCNLSGSHGGSSGEKTDPRSALDNPLFPSAFRENDEGETC